MVKIRKYEIVQKNQEFNSIIKTGKYKKNNFFVLYYIDNNFDYPRFGITLPTKIGNAVTRNKLKRQLRAIIDKNKLLFKSGKDYIIIIRTNAIDLKFYEMEEKLISIIE